MFKLTNHKTKYMVACACWAIVTPHTIIQEFHETAPPPFIHTFKIETISIGINVQINSNQDRPSPNNPAPNTNIF